MASLLGADGQGTTTADAVSIPSSYTIDAGGTLTIPVGLENNNPNYVAFQMEIALPQGFSPVLNEKGKIAFTKTERMDESHSITYNYDAESNIIKLICTSMESATFSGNSGELFSFDIQAAASTGAGFYSLSIKNILFSTSSSAPEGAVGYTLSNVKSNIYIKGEGGLLAPEAFQMNPYDYGIGDGYSGYFDSGYTWYGGFAFDVVNPFEEEYSGKEFYFTYNTLTIDGTAFNIQYGIQGMNNPRTEDGGNPANTLAPPANGSVIQINAKQDGWMYVVTRISTNKQYTVFEDGKAIGYKLAMADIDNTGYFLDNKVEIEVVGEGAYNYVTEPISNVSTIATGESYSINGYGVIYFPVRAGSVYYVNACGSKIVWGGMYYSPKEALSVIVSSNDSYYDDIVIVKTESKEVLIEALTTQISTSETAISQLVNPNIPGVADLQTLIEEARKLTIDSDVSTLKDTLNRLTRQTNAVVSLDREYQSLAELLTTVEGTIQQNPSADPTLVSEVTTKISEVRTGLTNGAYNSQDIAALTDQMNRYNSLLSQLYLTINVTQPGTLNSLILAQASNYEDVKGLNLSGKLNDSDLQTLRNLTGMIELNMAEAQVTELQYSQFSNMQQLEKVVLPNSLTKIPGECFYYCTALTDVTLPEGLQSIEAYAFYNCYNLTSINLPEGLKSLGYYCFGYCSALTEIELPSTLASIDSRPFGYSQNLKSITVKSIIPVELGNYLISYDYDSQCKLYVPNMAVDTYRAANYWQNMQIEGIDYQPENIAVASKVSLTWPEEAGSAYKPNVRIERNQNYGAGDPAAYGSLTVNGESTVWFGDFTAVWEPEYENWYSKYNESTGNYEGSRYSYTTLMANTPIRANSVNVELTTGTYQWNFITFPFDVKVSDIKNIRQTGAPLVIRRYDGKNRADSKMSETWVDMTEGMTLEAGKGYIWQSANGDEDYGDNVFLVTALDNDKKKNIFTTEDVTVALDEYTSEFSQNRSWNLIGNPYPTYYDIHFLGTNAPITVWNSYNRVYQAYVPGDDEYVLNPGQAFFIQRPLNQESITFNQEGRQTDTNIRLYDNNGNGNGTLSLNTASERQIFNLQLTGIEEGQADRTRIVVNPNAAADYELGRDAAKFMSSEAEAAQLYSVQNGIRFAINERPLTNGVIELGIATGVAGSYTIKLDTAAGNEVWLIDRETGEEISLNNTNGYTFTASKGTTEGRFAIRLGAGSVTGANIVVGQDNGVKINNNEPTYNLNGQQVTAPANGIFINDGNTIVVK